MWRKFLQFSFGILCSLTMPGALLAQDNLYRYSVDLTRVTNDQLMVELQTPAINQRTVQFYMPKIIPGTYGISDFGMFVTEVKAYNSKGKQLPVKKISTNSWQIKKADQLVRLTYMVEDIFDTEKENQVYMMAASNIEEGKNFVIQTPAFFGYFEGMQEIPFEVSITKPSNFYGSTGLQPVSTTATKDIFRTEDYDRLADAPLMYNEPDTTFINVGNARVLVSVYSPNERVSSSFLAEQFDKMLQAQKNYLGGKLPVDKYAFIMYFADPENANPRQGALEHSNSSFYYLSEGPQEQLAPLLVDIASHEFFHIVTPLTIHSKEIADFNFNEPVLSKHLWLYEGVTEYASHHVQLRSNLITPEQFLAKMAAKINTSQTRYNDTLPFTQLSKESAGIHAEQYGNVYEKGALIAALLDIRLLELSSGRMDLQDLLLQLGNKYGANDPFNDDKLFEVIESMTYPQIGDFFSRYVAGNEPLPYEEYFRKVGVAFQKEPDKMVATFGKVSLGYNAEKQLLEIAGTEMVNEFGKNIGYKKGDLLVKLQGKEITPATFIRLMEEYSNNTKAGATVELVVLRPNDIGEYKEVTLTAPAMLVKSVGKVTLEMAEDASLEQQRLRNSWIKDKAITADPQDVASIDAIIQSLYDVISGPAGERDWERFHSLFKPEASMAAVASTKDGQTRYVHMKPQEYQTRNAANFARNGFYEEEIGRQQSVFGEIAHVWSAYQFRLSPEAQPQQRGINSIQLVFDQGRWWITSILWNAERNNNTIPKDLIKNTK
jgi:predicted metalloprotease with PDZ domain